MSDTTKHLEDHRLELGTLMKNLRLEKEKTLRKLQKKQKFP